MKTTLHLTDISSDRITEELLRALMSEARRPHHFDLNSLTFMVWGTIPTTVREAVAELARRNEPLNRSMP